VSGPVASPDIARPTGSYRPRRVGRHDRDRRREGRLHLFLAVRWRGSDLDRRLAAGEDPRGSDALALRALRITTRRGRASVAGGLAGILRSARAGRLRFTAAVTPNRSEVLEAAAVIAAVERRLRAAEPVAAHGVAMVRLLLIDGNGPLYRPGEPGVLGSRLRAAAAALQVAGEVDRGRR
jgi:hypothetical protein